MRRRSFLAAGLLTPLAASFLGDSTALAAGRRFSYATDGSAFLLDGKPFQIRSGEMHPARIPVQYWRHRIQMAKAMGLNTIAIYIMWNYLEEREGVFDLTTDRRDFAAFIRLCQEEGMYVILRPGPYVCGEWDLGGLPAWLLKHDPMSLRVRESADQHYFPAVRRYVNTIAPVLKPLMIDNGGPIIMVQVENEYGSFGNDQQYLLEVRKLWQDNGIDGPFYTQDSLGFAEQNHTVVPGGAIGLSGGDAAQIARCRKSFPDVPALSGELYPGWLTHWGDKDFEPPRDMTKVVKDLMAGGLSFNFYMVHGGTNFGFWAGANSGDDGGNYLADLTSYDYSAPINEQGAATEHYQKYRAIIGGHLGAALPPVPPPPPAIAPAAVTPVPFASLWDNLPAALPGSEPKPMEQHGQNLGFVLYRRSLPAFKPGTLNAIAVHDYATVFLDGEYQGGYSRSTALPATYTRKHRISTTEKLPVASAQAEPVLDVLVEGLGRINYGHAMVDRKGITKQVSLDGGGALTGGWQTFPLPMDESFVAGLRPSISDKARPGLFFKAALALDSVGDTYVDMSDWTHGVVWVNGHNLGRYWEIGPQLRLYCPATFLRPGLNEIVVFDLHQTEPARISFNAKLG
ncbi:beta-galactosidase [Pseudonocardiaceae bacterium YIM PH 21723]|nr:beta-galactosidase [Pseudonocardiaceae bacterium YIM PH 21723]